MVVSEQLQPPEVLIKDNFLAEHAALFDLLRQSILWDESMAVRKTASFGVPYNYAQLSYPAVPMHAALAPVVAKLSAQLGVEFNNCLLNYYESGENTMGFHADDTTGLQELTGVAIVSLGSTRKITYRSKIIPTIRHAFNLAPGSLLYMDSVVQETWVHAIRKQRDVGPRISLTWRAFR